MSPRAPSRLRRVLRKIRRWARHTPNGTIAVNLGVAGVALLLLAALLAITIL